MSSLSLSIEKWSSIAPSTWLLAIQLSAVSKSGFDECCYLLKNLRKVDEGFLYITALQPSVCRSITEVPNVPEVISESFGTISSTWDNWFQLNRYLTPPWSSSNHQHYALWVRTLASTIQEDPVHRATISAYTQLGLFQHRILADIETARLNPNRPNFFFDSLPPHNAYTISKERFAERESSETYLRLEDYERAQRIRKIEKKLGAKVPIPKELQTARSTTNFSIRGRKIVFERYRRLIRSRTKTIRKSILLLLYSTSVYIRKLARIAQRYFCDNRKG